jgi:hypothetical protein
MMHFPHCAQQYRAGVEERWTVDPLNAKSAFIFLDAG